MSEMHCECANKEADTHLITEVYEQP